MALDLDAMAGAIAAQYASLTPPAGLAAIRNATAKPPGAITVTPAVVVTADAGVFRTGNGSRTGSHNWWVRFYLDQDSDVERYESFLRRWANVLLYAHLTNVHLSGTVDVTRIESYRIGVLAYGQVDYVGIELVIHTETTEGWPASPT